MYLFDNMRFGDIQNIVVAIHLQSDSNEFIASKILFRKIVLLYKASHRAIAQEDARLQLGIIRRGNGFACYFPIFLAYSAAEFTKLCKSTSSNCLRCHFV